MAGSTSDIPYSFCVDYYPTCGVASKNSTAFIGIWIFQVDLLAFAITRPMIKNSTRERINDLPRHVLIFRRSHTPARSILTPSPNENGALAEVLLTMLLAVPQLFVYPTGHDGDRFHDICPNERERRAYGSTPHNVIGRVSDVRLPHGARRR